jgi:hypothetical protein
MTQTPSFRDVEKLSAYLDGQLKVSEIARLEARLQTEPELASALKNLREARGVLRGLPQRRAPRNFILTPKMVGSKPPMPRSYPVFRFATVLATLFLFLTFATNFIAPRLVRTAAPYPYGLGGYGGGGGGEESEMQMEEPAAAEPAPAEGEPAPTMMSTPAALAEEESTAEDSMRTEGTAQPNAVEKSGPGENYAQDLTPEPDEATQAKSAPPIGITTQITLAGIAALCAIIALILRYNTIRKWRVKAK